MRDEKVVQRVLQQLRGGGPAQLSSALDSLWWAAPTSDCKILLLALMQRPSAAAVPPQVRMKLLMVGIS